jgi:hypothetical protein
MQMIASSIAGQRVTYTSYFGALQRSRMQPRPVTLLTGNDAQFLIAVSNSALREMGPMGGKRWRESPAAAYVGA